MGNLFSQSAPPTPPPTPPPIAPSSPLLKTPWIAINFDDKKDLLKSSREYKPDGAKHLRIMVYGPVSAGKSSLINSVGSVVAGHPVNYAEPDSKKRTASFTNQWRTHKMVSEGEARIVISDLMGLQGEGGAKPDDIKQAMKGHIKEGYPFNSALSEDNLTYFRKNPSIDDKVHVVVCVLNANATEIDKSILDKIAAVREAARDLGIPQLAIVTHIDDLCEEIENDVENVYKSKVLKATMKELSDAVGYPINNMFPVWNHCQTDQKDGADFLILNALKHMLLYGDGYIKKDENQTNDMHDSEAKII